MTTPGEPAKDREKSEFEQLSDKQQDVSLAVEFWQFIRENKKWWMIPILVVFLLLAGLIYLSAATAWAPFMYPVF